MFQEYLRIYSLISPFFSLFFLGTVNSFLGNQTHNDHFKLLQSDGHSLLIGARNVVYNLSLSDLAENREQVKKYVNSTIDGTNANTASKSFLATLSFNNYQVLVTNRLENCNLRAVISRNN